MAKYIDADMLEKSGWNMHRLRQASATEMIYETKKPTDFPAADVEPRWIPVTERLPEQEGRYLVSCNTDYGIEVARMYIDEDGERYFGCDWNDPDDIEAWMPLPEPYKRGEWKNEKNDKPRNM